jgi:ketosteroid isomerase-like protein
MSAKSVAIVRGAIDSVNAGDLEALVRLTTPDFEYDISRTESPLRGVYPRNRLLRVMTEFIEPWQSYHYEIHELIDAGDHVVVDFTTHFTGRGGIEVKGDATWVWTLRGERIVRVCLYQDAAEGRAAAGLPAARD